jgi:cell division protein FtsW
MPRNLQFDWQLFSVTVALCLTGAVLVFSASAMTAREQFGNPYMFLIRQLAWLAIGCTGMLFLMNFDYRKLRAPRMIFGVLAVNIILLMAVLLLDRSHSTHRWVRLGPVSLQPSEFAKLAVILFLAWFLEQCKISGRYDVNDAVHTLTPAMAPVVLIAGLILLGKDLGTAASLR